MYAHTPLNETLLGSPGPDHGNGPFHGTVYFQYMNQKNVGKGNQLRLGLNTDTIWIIWDIGERLPGPWSFTIKAQGQFGFAGMTPDYFQAGRFYPDAGFLSFYGLFGGQARYRLTPALRVVGHLELRQWFFMESTDAVGALVLPRNGPGIRAFLGLHLFKMKKLRKGRLQQGINAKIELHGKKRLNQEKWGAVDINGKMDLRNRFEPGFLAVQWFASVEAALCLHRTFGASLQISGGQSWQADDLQRFQIGGDLPFLPQVSGTYFSEFVVDDYLLVNLRFFWLPLERLRLIPQFDFFLGNDLSRTNQLSELTSVIGLGLQTEFFLSSAIRLVLKMSYAPNVTRPTTPGGFKVVLGVIGSWWP